MLLGKIGQGGSASVFRAFDRIDQRLVALKVFEGTAPSGPSHPLSAEYERGAVFSHPNVVRPFELCVAQDGPLPHAQTYLVLEHVPGGPIHRALTPGRIALSKLDTISRQLLLALRHVHSHDCVHRDVKPANVLVESTAGPLRIKLTDFGLSAQTGHREPLGTITGSIPYVPPEAVLGQPVDARSDLYSLGVLLFHLSTGELPVVGNVEEILHWHLSGPPADPKRYRPELPDRFARFVRRLTEKERDRRPGSADAALALLGNRAEMEATKPASVDRGELARLRLALDAVRLGQHRRLRLPHAADQRHALVRQARAWSHARTVTFCEIEANDCAPSLTRTVQRLLLRSGASFRRRWQERGLERCLPLHWLDGQLLFDQARHERRTVIRPRRAQLEKLARFLIDSAAQSPTVLYFSGTSSGHGLADRLLSRMMRVARGYHNGSGGGLLLLHDSQATRDRDLLELR